MFVCSSFSPKPEQPKWLVQTCKWKKYSTDNFWCPVTFDLKEEIRGLLQCKSDVTHLLQAAEMQTTKLSKSPSPGETIRSCGVFSWGFHPCPGEVLPPALTHTGSLPLLGATGNFCSWFLSKASFPLEFLWHRELFSWEDFWCTAKKGQLLPINFTWAWTCDSRKTQLNLLLFMGFEPCGTETSTAK